MSPDEETLFCLRVRYVKRGRLRYLSHLELLRAIERMVRRARLPYAVTKGFSPHMKAAYGPALPVGVASRDEWFDVFLTSLAPASEYLARLVAAAPAGIAPQEAAYVPLCSDSLSAALTISCYEAFVVPAGADGMPLEASAAELDVLASRLGGAFSEVLASGEVSYVRNGKPKVVGLAGKVAREPVVDVVAGVPAELADNAGTAQSPCVRAAFATRSSNEGALRPDVLMAAVAARLQAASAVGREEGAGEMPCGVSSACERVRVLILRGTQHLESEDGTWVRPI